MVIDGRRHGQQVHIFHSSSAGRYRPSRCNLPIVPADKAVSQAGMFVEWPCHTAVCPIAAPSSLMSNKLCQTYPLWNIFG